MSRKIVLSLFLVCVMLVTTGIAYPVQARPAYSWEQVNAPDIVVPGQMFTALEEFQGQLYAGTENFFYTSSVPEPVGVWRSTNGRKWTKVLDAGTSNWLHFQRTSGARAMGPIGKTWSRMASATRTMFRSLVFPNSGGCSTPAPSILIQGPD